MSALLARGHRVHQVQEKNNCHFPGKKKCLDYNDEQGEMNLSFELTGLLISMVRVPTA